MIRVRLSKERGYEDKGWLQTYHTFSFDTYYDPEFLGVSCLRVINEDRLPGGKGFGIQYQKEMELLTYVVEGSIEHKDSLGNTTVLQAGELQALSAGTGVTFSEYNLSHHLPVHLLQIWLSPSQISLEPSYSKRLFSPASRWGQWCLLASFNGRHGSLRVHQDIDLYGLLLQDGEEIEFPLSPEHHYWVHIISGKFDIQGQQMEAGDGALIDEEEVLKVKNKEYGELFLIDLP